jgi:adenylate cyclase
MGLAHFAEGRYEEAASWLERSHRRRPDLQITHRALAATYASLGRMEEAQLALQEYLRLAPGETVSRVRAQFPYVAPDFLERYLDGLRKAGLKE